MAHPEWIDPALSRCCGCYRRRWLSKRTWLCRRCTIRQETTVVTTYREGCGTFLGARLHQAAGEALCSDCAHREATRLLSLEGIPTRPIPDEKSWPDITPKRAATNRRVLAEATRKDSHA